MRLELNSPISEEQWRAIENAGIRILADTGMKIVHDEILGVLSRQSGVRVSGNIVRMAAEVVRDQTKPVKGTQAYDCHLMAGAYCHNWLDPATETIRPSALNDLVLSVRQAEALGMGVCAPVVPLDIAGPRQELVMERVTRENSRTSYGAGQYTTAAAAEASLEMAAVVGRPHELEIWVNSPLNLDPTGLDILWKLRHRRPPVRIANMPVRGMSAPITLAGLLAQSVAECLGAATVLQLLGVAKSVAYRVDAFWA